MTTTVTTTGKESPCQSLPCQVCFSYLIDLFVATVVPCSRVPLAVLVGHDRAKRVVHGLGRKVLRRDQHQAVSLTDLW